MNGSPKALSSHSDTGIRDECYIDKSPTHVPQQWALYHEEIAECESERALAIGLDSRIKEN
jgi:hypothetical protein